jgi:hypothetical protein
VGTTLDDNYTADSNPDLINPERGMYSGSKPNFGSVDKSNRHTIVAEWLWLAPVCNVNLTWNGHNQPGTSPALNAYAAKLEDARRDGYKILFRPRYDKEPGGRASDCMINGANVFHADTMERQKNHIDAVAAMLGDYKVVIAYIQAGYLGNWGEWNTFGEDEAGTSYTPANAPLLYSISQRNEIIDYVLAAYKAKDIMQHVELRRPVFAKEVVERNPSAKVGLHNDCFMTTTSDMGTYSNFDDCDPSTNPDCPNFATSAEAKAWAQSFTENASFGGETCPEVPTGSERWLLCSNMTGASSEPASLHMNYLNRDFSEKAVETWKDGDAQGNVCYDEIRRRLGYRFEVRSVEYTKAVSAGGTFSVAVDVENTGWARLHKLSDEKPRDAKLVLRNGATTPVEYQFSGGTVSNWAPGTTTTISVSEPAPPPGTYRVWLGIPDPDLLNPDDYPDAKKNYAVKLATLRNGENVFSSDTAENDLGVEITVHRRPRWWEWLPPWLGGPQDRDW